MRREPHVRFCERAAVKFRRATHLIVGFEHEADARRFWDVMRERLQEFAEARGLHSARLTHMRVRQESWQRIGGASLPRGGLSGTAQSNIFRIARQLLLTP
jgi:hypothetical protein